MKAVKFFRRNKQSVVQKQVKGQLYEYDNKIWKVTADLYRHDGHFIFIQRKDGIRIIMREVLFEEGRLRICSQK